MKKSRKSWVDNEIEKNYELSKQKYIDAILHGSRNAFPVADITNHFSINPPCIIKEYHANKKAEILNPFINNKYLK